MSAAEAMARASGDRMQITLLESKRVTGGRAGSFCEASSGETVDYCQHVMMGCCTNLIDLLERSDLLKCVRRYSELCFLHPNHPPSRFAASRILPPPIHLAGAVSSLKHLSATQRRQIRKGLWRLLRTRSECLVGRRGVDWLLSNDQDAETIRDFWDVILVSALAESADAVAMTAVRKVFADGFAGTRGASDVLVPSVPLADLFGQRMRAVIEDLGVRFLTEASAREVLPIESGRARVEACNGRRFEADHVIVAVPWHTIGSLLRDTELPDLDRYGRFPSSSITGIHMWFDREITARQHAVLVGTVSQWLFRQPFTDQSLPAVSTESRAIDSVAENGHYYQVVISASQQHRSITKKDLIEVVLGELRHAFPEARGARLLRSRIVTDPNSVFSLRPEVEAARPSATTPLPWLHLAGDWIDTGWPATMEGAVISGRMAAQSVLSRLGGQSLVVDVGQPRGWLANRLIRQ